MKFVLPATWRGAPPVITTCWPDSTKPVFLAAAIERRIMSSIVSDDAIWMVITPQHSERKSSVASLGVIARIGCLGRKRETRRGVDPDHVGAMMTAAFVCFATK